MRNYLLFVSQLYAFSILRPIQKAISARGDQAAWFVLDPLKTFIKPDERLFETVKDVKAYRPDAIFVAGNMAPDFFPGVKVQVFHGFNARKRHEKKGHYRLRGFFDLYCTQGPDTTQTFQKLAKRYNYFRVVETGWPKMDPLFEKTPGVIKHDRPVILFASTFTPRLSAAMPLLSTIKRLSATGRWQWFVNLHPKMDEEIVAKYRSLNGNNLTLVTTDNIIPLLHQADIMVSDTSSIIDEFCLQQKPAVTFRHRIPRSHLINISDPKQLESAIEEALTQPKKLMAEIHRYADKIHPYRDGRSSYRVLEATDRLVEDGVDRLSPKPLNLVRRLKIRKALGYYHWR